MKQLDMNAKQIHVQVDLINTRAFEQRLLEVTLTALLCALERIQDSHEMGTDFTPRSSFGSRGPQGPPFFLNQTLVHQVDATEYACTPSLLLSRQGPFPRFGWP